MLTLLSKHGMLGVYAATAIVTVSFRHNLEHLVWIWVLPVAAICGVAAAASFLIGVIIWRYDRDRADRFAAFANECCIALTSVILTVTGTLLLIAVLD